MISRPALACALLVVVRGFALAQAPAPGLSPEAKAHFDRALEAYNQQRYEQAIAEFKAAYAIDSRPELLYDIANAERLNGNCKAAVEGFEAFLQSGPEQVAAARARKNLERCRAVMASSSPAGPRPAAPPSVAAPSAPPATTAAGASAGEPATPPAGGSSLPPPGEGGAPTRPWYRDALGDALGLGGLATLVGGVLIWKSGHDDIEAANAAPSYGAYLSSGSGAEARQEIGVAAMVAGGALVGAGVVRYLLLRRPDRDRTTVSSAPARNGGMVVLLRRF